MNHVKIGENLQNYPSWYYSCQWNRYAFVVNSMKLQNGIRFESQAIRRKLLSCRMMSVIVKVASVYTGNCQEAKDIGTPWDISSRRDQFVWRRN